MMVHLSSDDNDDDTCLFKTLNRQVSFISGSFPFSLSYDKYCNPGYHGAVTAQRQSEPLVVFFFCFATPRAAK